MSFSKLFSISNYKTVLLRTFNYKTVLVQKCLFIQMRFKKDFCQKYSFERVLQLTISCKKVICRIVPPRALHHSQLLLDGPVLSEVSMLEIFLLKIDWFIIGLKFKTVFLQKVSFSELLVLIIS